MTKRRTPVPFDDVFTARDLGTVNATTSALAGWRARGEVVEVAPGVYAPRYLEMTAKLRSVFASRAIAEGREPLTVLGAAAQHGIATPPNLPITHSRLRDRPPVPQEHILRSGRLLVPTAAWTAVQLARGQRLEAALISLDSALRLGVQRSDLAQIVEEIQRWPGTSSLRKAVCAADARSGSALESLSRGLCIQSKLPIPDLQHPFRVRGQQYYVDFWWPEFNVIGEADGMVKYTDNTAINAEKRRQAALHSLGLHVVRWGWADVHPAHARWLAGMRQLLRP